MEEAEGLSLLHGLRVLAKYLNGPVQIEVDNLSLANVMSSRSINKYCLFPIIVDINAVLRGFRSFKIGQEQICPLPGLSCQEGWRLLPPRDCFGENESDPAR